MLCILTFCRTHAWCSLINPKPLQRCQVSEIDLIKHAPSGWVSVGEAWSIAPSGHIRHLNFLGASWTEISLSIKELPCANLSWKTLLEMSSSYSIYQLTSISFLFHIRVQMQILNPSPHQQCSSPRQFKSLWNEESWQTQAWAQDLRAATLTKVHPGEYHQTSFNTRFTTNKAKQSKL